MEPTGGVFPSMASGNRRLSRRVRLDILAGEHRNNVVIVPGFSTPRGTTDTVLGYESETRSRFRR